MNFNFLESIWDCVYGSYIKLNDPDSFNHKYI
jgi:hypothetical protein